MAYLLALDQGTTSSRALIFDESGHIHALAQQEFEQFYPRPGWVEHDPQEILKTQLDVAAEAIQQAQLTSRDIAGIGITNQRETCLLWERSSGRPCSNALVWQDRRGADVCEGLRAAGTEPMFSQKTGLLLDPYFSASKLHWMLNENADLRARAERGELAFGTIDSWLMWHLSGGRRHVTDATNASRTLLYNIDRNEWDDELLTLWQVPRAVLPEVVDSSGICATTTHFGSEIPIGGIAGDQQAALFGQACFSPGMAKCTYGTGCFVLLHTGSRSPRSAHKLLTTIACRINGITEYALEGSVFMGGATVQWLRDGLGIIENAAQIEALAGSVSDSGSVMLVPAFTGLGAPHWDAQAGALLIGMTRGSTRAHIARAALDGIAWQVRDVMTAMVQDADTDITELRVDGGASNNNLLMQTQADFLGNDLVRPRIIESTAFGAALLAGLAVGVFRDRKAITSIWQAEHRFQAQRTRAEIDGPARRWQNAVTRSRHWHEQS